MRKILLTLGIALAIYYFVQPKKNNSNLVSENPIPAMPSELIESETSEGKASVQNLKLQDDTPVLLPKTIEQDVKSETSPEPPEDKNDRIELRRRSALKLAKIKLQIPIPEELKKASASKTLNKNEVDVTGIYQGEFSINEQVYTVRLSLIIDARDYKVQPVSCISVYNSHKILFKEFYGDGKMTLLRMPEDHYFIIAVKDQYYFQVFVTYVDYKRALIAHLATKEQRAPIVFELNSIGGRPRDGCE